MVWGVGWNKVLYRRGIPEALEDIGESEEALEEEEAVVEDGLLSKERY